METIRTTIFLPFRYHRTLKQIAHENKTSMAQLILKALDDVFFKKNRKSAKDLFGLIQNTNISEEEFKKIKSKLNPNV